MKQLKKLIKPLLICSVALLLLIAAANTIIFTQSDDYIYTDPMEVPTCYTAIVLGAKVYSKGIPSDFLQDRLDVAIDLYKHKKVTRLLLSGDHGQTTYDEVNSMKDYLIDHGIPTEDIFLDHAGFDTYNSMVRALKIFQIKEAIIVTQEFHLPRAVYIARSKGLEAYGVAADKRRYATLDNLRFRELLAKVKAFAEVSLNRQPRYLGPPIPITGDSKLSYD
jgi:SanA protein